MKQKGDSGKRWTYKKGKKYPRNIKGEKSTNSKGSYKNQQSQNLGIVKKTFKPHNELKAAEQSSKSQLDQFIRPPLHFWGCGEPHYIKNYPY